MFSRMYCAVFFAISGLLFAFNVGEMWSITFLFFGFLPHLKRLKLKKTRFLLAFHLLIGLTFFVYGTFFVQQAQSTLLGTETIFQGTVKTKPQLTSSNREWSFNFLLDENEKLQVFYPNQPGKDPPVLARERCTFAGVLEQATPSKNPYSFDYQQYLSEQNIDWIIRLSEDDLICEQEDNLWLRFFDTIRHRGIDQLLRKNDSETSALMAALVFGDRTFMSENTMAQYRQLGILHLLAVSGLHVGLITFALFFILYRFGLTRELSGFLVFSFLPVYMIIAGGSPSVLRASLMCMIYLLVVALNWKIKAIDVVALVALFLLIVNPFYIYHLGFQLSVLTSFTLLLSTSLFKTQSRIILLLKVTGVAQLISLPLTLYHSFELSLFTIPMNLVFIPFISFFVLPCAFITVIFQQIIPSLSELSYWLVSKSLMMMDRLLSIATGPSWSVIMFGRPSGVMLWMMMVVIIVSLLLFEKNRRIIPSLLLIAVFSLQWALPYFNGKAIVTMLDVGQGEAIVIELPYRRGVYLVDTGGRLTWGDNHEKDIRQSTGPGKYVVEPFLKGKGIKKIDVLLLSHGHVDHIGEACYLSSKLSVANVFYPKGLPVPETAESRLNCLAEDGVSISMVEKGFGWKEGDDWFYILHPDGPQENENNRSIVLLASLNSVHFLFTGDLEELGEKQLLKNFPTLTTDVLKVGHHGSNTSTTGPFIEQIEPEFGLISAGENNRYGHPHDEVSIRLEEQGVMIYRTTRHGAISLEVWGGQINVEPYFK
ncbi:DNA internalization-related competence protein ComEC/Rec2 [Salipaludibacillus sp. HK11]|uniref:DNA internalization-related competence protein ComEC/Rec2 n=1 Tax=Salipaludibacillus sp. HK11 TaxID=3394320 RepID=UPI0039FD1A74